METEQTLVLIKPDGVQRGLIGEIIARYEHKGLKIVGMKLLQFPRETAETLYAIHQGKPFYDVLIEFIISAPIVALAIEGRDAMELVRILNGETDPKKSQPGTIRGDFSINITHNIVHASDSLQSAQRELEIVFAPEERYKYHRMDEAILHPPVV
ncbi:MAG: nucleoside-diphosphate kinase [Candidatus Poribacteria bacterium]|nr:nucleoside-diphosphate kinase [Candidatus Poribacteria bacterium]